MTKLSRLTRYFVQGITLVVLIALVGAFAGVANAAAPTEVFPDIPDAGVAPYQSAVLQLLEARVNEGMPAPALSAIETSITETTVDPTAYQPVEYTRPDSSPLLQPITRPQTRTTIATTTIHFDGPEQMGFTKWPAVRSLVEGEDFNFGRSYEAEFRAAVEIGLPELLEEYEYGTEPRTYTFTETTTVSYVFGTLPSAALAPTAAAPGVPDTQPILMGFTFDFSYSYTLSDGLSACVDLVVEEVCASANITIQAFFEAGFGFRVPAEVTLAGPAQVEQGEDFFLTATLNKQNWSAADFNAAGVAGGTGNEFVMFAGVGVSLEASVTAPIVGTLSTGTLGASKNFDESASFITPFDGTPAPLPAINVPIYSVSAVLVTFSVDIVIEPALGSDLIRADWEAVSGCTGSGSINFTQAGVPVQVGPITASCLGGETNLATVQLKNFRYIPNLLQIDIGLSLGFSIGVDIGIANISIFSDSVVIPLYTVELSLSSLEAIFGDLPEPALVKHYQCAVDFNVTTSINVFDTPTVTGSPVPACGPVGPPNVLEYTTTIVDTMVPVASHSLSGTTGNNGWYVSDVTITLLAEDGVCNNASTWIQIQEPGAGGFGAPIQTDEVTLTNDGIYEVQYWATDLGGNVSPTTSFTVKIDQTPPEIGGYATTDPNDAGWYNTDVTVTFSDPALTFDPQPGSGLLFVTPDVTLTTEGENQSVNGVAEDVAGNISMTTVGGINIDKTPPEVTINSPAAGEYYKTDSIIIDWTATDNLSGVDNEAALLDGSPVANGEEVDLLFFTVGEHIVTVEVSDVADNVTVEFVTFEIITSIEQMQETLDLLCELGFVIKQGICHSLMVKLENAENQFDKGKYHVAINMMDAFLNQLTAQNEKAVDIMAFLTLQDSALANIMMLEELEAMAALSEPSLMQQALTAASSVDAPSAPDDESDGPAPPVRPSGDGTPPVRE